MHRKPMTCPLVLKTIFAKLNPSANPCMYEAIDPEMKPR